ncbi:MAG: RNA 3'-terminal phosphate cyclase [Candidatus Woesearchaeota archaeon]
MIEIDGSMAEGGGQIVRTALGLSSITLKPFRITNIRKNRSNPGLSQQHVMCIKACAQMTNAFVSGNNVGSTEIEFIPKVIKNRQFIINIGTAGSIPLLLQGLLPALLFTESDITITGGTDVQWSMPIDYFRHVLLPALMPYCNVTVLCEKRGYYPAGEGKVIIRTKPRFRRPDFDTFQDFYQFIFGNPPLELHKKGELICIKGVSHASQSLQGNEVSERQADTAELMLRKECPVDLQRTYAHTSSIGSGIVLYALYNSSGNHHHQYRIGADFLGQKKIKAEEVARNAVEKLRTVIHAPYVVDDVLQDNLIPFLGLFGGRMLSGPITEHTRANIAVCEAFLKTTYIIENYNDAILISVLNSSNA